MKNDENNEEDMSNTKHSIAVEDGTGVIEIHYKMQQYMSMLEQRQQINEKYRNLAGNLKKNETKVVQNVPNKLPKSRPGFIYSRDTSLQDIAVSLKINIYYR